MRICQKICVIISDKSDADNFVCQTPDISTTKSNEKFHIREEADLRGSEIIFEGITQEMADLAFNDKPFPSIYNSTTSCHVGVKFATGYVGVLQELTFFLDVFDTELIAGNLTF